MERVNVEMWPDAVSGSEDIIRLRFSYQNISDREIERFTAEFGIWNWTGDGLISDQMAVTDILQPGETSSWSVSYRHSDCPWISTENWRELSQRDIRSLGLQWQISTVTFMDGQILTTESGLPFTDPGHPDSSSYIERFRENRVE